MSTSGGSTSGGGTASGAPTDGTAPAPTTLTGKKLYVTGHSYTIEPGIMCTAGQEWPNKLIAKAAMTAGRAGVGISGSRPGLGAATCLGKATVGGVWVPGSAGLGIIEYASNDYQFGNHATTAQVQNAVNAYTAMVAALQAGSIDQVTAAWSVGDSTQAGNNFWGDGTSHFSASVATPVLTVPIDSTRCLGGVCRLLIYVEAGNTRTLTVKQDGVQIATFNKTLQGGTDGVPTKAVIKLTGLPTSGSNVFTVEGSATGAGNVAVEAVIYPAAAPMPVLVLKDPVPKVALEGTMAYAKYSWDADLDTVVSGFTSCWSVDLQAGGWWDDDLHLGSDRLHPNDAGMVAISNRVSTVAARLGL